MADYKPTQTEIKQAQEILEPILKEQIIYSHLIFREAQKFAPLKEGEKESIYLTFAIMRDKTFYPDAVSINSSNQSYQIVCHSRKY